MVNLQDPILKPKCNYAKSCSVKKIDGTCGASILGYCPYQEKPVVAPVAHVEPPKSHLAENNAVTSQDAWIAQTIANERAGHIHQRRE
jgi:hypothetical protein